MNANRANRWLALVANMSVVAGLVFLAVEVRQNTESQNESRRLAAATAYQARAFATASIYAANASSPELIAALVSFEAAGGKDRPREALAGLSPEDRQRLFWFYVARSIVYDNNFYQYRNGYLDKDRYESIDAAVIGNESAIWDALGLLQTSQMTEEMERLRNPAR